MNGSRSQAVLPVFFFLCLLLGGSSQSGGSLILQLGAIGIIAWVVTSSSPDESCDGSLLLGLLIAFMVLLAVQITPLPHSWWRSFPAREHVEAGYLILDMEMPALPISLTPHATLGALLYLLPPVAVLLVVLRSGEQRTSWLLAALFVGTLLGILLGYVQVATGRSGTSTWYIYERTNVGAPVGFFANRNHMGTLLLMALPYVFCLFNREKVDLSRMASLRSLSVGLLIFILLSLAINGSLAAVALAVPVVVASALLLPSVARFRAWLGVAALLATTGSIIFLVGSAVQTKITGVDTSSFESRREFWRRTWLGIESNWPVGTGVGSFDSVYAGLEPAEGVTPTYVNHAHNDYLEVLLETGLAGAVLLAVFFVWWVGQAIRIFKSSRLQPIAGAAVIASGAALGHSVVDYPLRTAAIASAFALCVGLMVNRRRDIVAADDDDDGDDELRRARHLKIA